jgi:hypothetical protein
MLVTLLRSGLSTRRGRLISLLLRCALQCRQTTNLQVSWDLHKAEKKTKPVLKTSRTPPAAASAAVAVIGCALHNHRRP